MKANEKNADTTHIRITNENWLILNRMKNPGDSFDDVLSRLLSEKTGGPSK